MTKSDLNKDINFLYEMGNIRYIERLWRRFGHDDFANLAEHHFRVFWIAMIIAAHEDNADTGKIAKLVLLHDIAESRTGDVDYISRQYVERNEEMAIHDILHNTSIEKEFLELWQEYEDRQTIEAKIAKDADNLDVDFELAEQAAKGSRLQNVKKPSRDHVASEKLFTKTAKELYKQLKSSDPHDWWWLSPRNRNNAGDWKKK
jgi:putative hydrolase of HD superfamily